MAVLQRIIIAWTPAEWRCAADILHAQVLTITIQAAHTQTGEPCLCMYSANLKNFSEIKENHSKKNFFEWRICLSHSFVLLHFCREAYRHHISHSPEISKRANSPGELIAPDHPNQLTSKSIKNHRPPWISGNEIIIFSTQVVYCYISINASYYFNVLVVYISTSLFILSFLVHNLCQ